MLKPGLDEQQRLEGSAEPGVCNILDLGLKPQQQLPLHGIQQAWNTKKNLKQTSKLSL